MGLFLLISVERLGLLRCEDWRCVLGRSCFCQIIPVLSVVWDVNKCQNFTNYKTNILHLLEYQIRRSSFSHGHSQTVAGVVLPGVELWTTNPSQPRGGGTPSSPPSPSPPGSSSTSVPSSFPGPSARAGPVRTGWSG